MSAESPRSRSSQGVRRARRLAPFVGLALLAGLGACSPASGPVERGDLQIALQDHPQAAPGGTVGLLPALLLAHHKNFGGDYFHGRLTADVRVLLSTDGVVWRDAVAADGLAVDLQAPDRRATFAARLPVGTYRHLRLVLQNAEAMLDPGSAIGGLELNAVERVWIEEGGQVQAQLALPAPLEISATGSGLMSIDLNAESWVTEDHVVAGSVPAVEVIRSIEVEIGTVPARSFLRSL